MQIKPGSIIIYESRDKYDKRFCGTIDKNCLGTQRVSPSVASLPLAHIQFAYFLTKQYPWQPENTLQGIRTSALEKWIWSIKPEKLISNLKKEHLSENEPLFVAICPQGQKTRAEKSSIRHEASTALPAGECNRRQAWKRAERLGFTGPIDRLIDWLVGIDP